VAIEHGRCIHCLRCRHDTEGAAVPWDSNYEWASYNPDKAIRRLEAVFGRSLHIRFVDAGACSACISEARQLNNPYYNMHRLGFFMTPTPRNADVLLVSGPVSDAMRLPLQKAYDAMPEPKRVVAIGACAIFGGVFGPSFAAAGGASEILPVDVVIPGCPPPPLAILHGLLLVVQRKPPAKLIATASEQLTVAT
jgi:Ni,Fe-hydrogenase III small subunit